MLVVVAVAAFSAGVVSSASGSYCDPLGGCASVKTSPSSVKAGSVTKISGNTGGCRGVTVYSNAFNHATRHSYHGVPSVSVRAARSGKFSFRIRISRRVSAGKYGVAGRCGGKRFASSSLKVHH